jgi:hypothetical protein
VEHGAIVKAGVRDGNRDGVWVELGVCKQFVGGGLMVRVFCWQLVGLGAIAEGRDEEPKP